MPAYNLLSVMKFYNTFAAPRDTRADYEQGARDGERNLPRHDQAGLSPYELEIVCQAQGDLAKFSGTVANECGAAQSLTARQKLMRLEQYESERRDIASHHDQDVDALSYRSGPTSRRAQDEDMAAFEAAQTYDALFRQEDEREPSIHFATPATLWGMLSPYTLLLLILATAELAINETVFAEALSLRAALAWGVATLFGISVIYFAHTVGLFIRRRDPGRTRNGKKRFRIVVPLIILVMLALFYEMSVIRQYLFVSNDANQAVANGLGILGASDKVAGEAGKAAEGVAKALMEDPFQPLHVKALTLFMVNVIVFSVGALISYFRHDPHPDYEKLMRNRDAAQAKVDLRQREYDDELARLDEGFRRRHTNLTARSDQLQRVIEHEQLHLAGLEKRQSIEANKVIDVATQRILAYQAGNSHSRRESPPAYFGETTMRLVRRLVLTAPEDLGEFFSASDDVVDQAAYDATR